MAEDEVYTLLIRLAGPLQSWGSSSRWGERDTGGEPSKSGVVGLIAAALGRKRSEPVDDLAALVMGVRVDHEGVPGYDFQTAGGGMDHPGIAQAKDSQKNIRDRLEAASEGRRNYTKGGSSISRRHFLQDAMFLVGLQGADKAFLDDLDAHLRAPVFPLGLGRRGYVPSIPVALPGNGVRRGDLMSVLSSATWPTVFDGMDVLLGSPESDEDQAARRQIRMPYMYQRQFYRMTEGDTLELRAVIESTEDLQAVIESTDGNANAVRQDQPIGAAFETRVFGPRPVVFTKIHVPYEHLFQGVRS